MATTNSTDDPRKNAASTLIYRMQRGDGVAYSEAVRRVWQGCKYQSSEDKLVAAGAKFETKFTNAVTPAMPSPKDVAVKATTPVIVADQHVPEGYVLAWVKDLHDGHADKPVLIPAA
jgi:hypothetical protein